MKHLLIIALSLVTIALVGIIIELYRIEIELTSFRPVRTYFQTFDVANCDQLIVVDEPQLPVFYRWRQRDE